MSSSVINIRILPRMRRPFKTESEKRIRELHMYDVLRADRCISVHSMEAQGTFWRSRLRRAMS